jgi:hypothetical protein
MVMCIGRRMLAVAGALCLLGGLSSFSAPLETPFTGRELADQQQQQQRQVRLPRPFKVLAGIKVGQEGVSRAPGVDGGSYLYAELSAFLGAYLGINAKYSVNLFPNSFRNHLIGLQSRFHIPLTKDLWAAVEVGYLLATDYRLAPEHFVGATVSPLYSGDLQGVSVELLPFSVYFNLRTGEALLMLELLSLGFSFPH